MKKRTIPTEEDLFKLIADPEMRKLLLEDAEADNISVKEMIQKIMDQCAEEKGESYLQFGNLN